MFVIDASLVKTNLVELIRDGDACKQKRPVKSIYSNTANTAAELNGD